jgi:hypothetical protein
MATSERLRYALYGYIAVSMITTLALSILSADSIELIPDIDIGRLLFNPFFLVPILVISYLVAPWLAQRFPLKRKWQ